ncbi:MAG TPA: aldo/keto reductase [Azospirillum sp.]|nr:aldo/keto reductase [Azospirillum sp.]
MTTKLPQRTAARGRLTVSCVGLGCMGMSEFYGATDDAASVEVLREALDLGVTFFDTADVYGYGHNERLVGRVLKESGRRGSVVLASKCGILRDEQDPTVRGVDNSPAYIKAACGRSLDRLGTGIDLYYLHRIAEGGAHIEASMDAMADLLAEGKIGHVGLSEASAPVIRRAHARLLERTDGRQGLSAVQTEYSLMSRGPEQDGVLDACRELDILFVPYSPIGRGLLTGGIEEAAQLDTTDFRRSLPRFQGDAMAHNRALVDKVQDMARSHGCTPAQLALAWVLAKGEFIAPIPGTKRSRYLRENIAAAQVQLSPDDVLTLDTAFSHGAVSGGRYALTAMAAYGLTE